MYFSKQISYKVFLFLLFILFAFSHRTACSADSMYMPGQENALLKQGRSTLPLAGNAFHEESGYGLIAVQDGTTYQLTILQKKNNQEWTIVATNDALSSEQGIITGIYAETHETMEGQPGNQCTFRVEFDEAPKKHRAFTICQTKSGEWNIQHIEGAQLTADQTFQQWILVPNTDTAASNKWNLQFRVFDDTAVYEQHETEFLPSAPHSIPEFSLCNPLTLLEEGKSQFPPHLKTEESTPKISTISPALVDQNGNIAVIDDGNIFVYHYATMELLWQASFEGEEFSVSRNTDPSVLSFITKTEDHFILHRVNTQERKRYSYPLVLQQNSPLNTVQNGVTESRETGSLPEKPQGPFHFVQDGVIYKSRQGTVRKYSFVLQDAYTLAFSQPVSDIYHAVSSDRMDYIIHSAGQDDNRMICVSGFTKNNKHRFTTALYSPSQVQAALCEAIAIGDRLIIAFHPRYTSDPYEPMLWISEQGEIIRRQPIEEKNCSISLRQDGKTDHLYVFLNMDRNTSLHLNVYNQQGERIRRQTTRHSSPFTGYFCIQDTWYIWNDKKTGLVPLF